MRRCLPGDLYAAAACVAAVEPSLQAVLADRLLAEADAAHRYAKRFGRAHPKWGNGSLMSRAKLSGEVSAVDPTSRPFFAALAVIAARLCQRKSPPYAQYLR